LPGILATFISVTFANAQQGWAVGDDGVIVTTSDGGETWKCPLNSPW
jgi:photosystem II stability/assembly factor-like uncharacterized protein